MSTASKVTILVMAVLVGLFFGIWPGVWFIMGAGMTRLLTN
jgi:hypothetical protein